MPLGPHFFEKCVAPEAPLDFHPNLGVVLRGAESGVSGFSQAGAVLVEDRAKSKRHR